MIENIAMVEKVITTLEAWLRSSGWKISRVVISGSGISRGGISGGGISHSPGGGILQSPKSVRRPLRASLGP